jgi:hypothetical protein
MTEQIREALAAALDATDVDALVTKAHVEHFLDDVAPALAAALTPAPVPYDEQDVERVARRLVAERMRYYGYTDEQIEEYSQPVDHYEAGCSLDGSGGWDCTNYETDKSFHAGHDEYDATAEWVMWLLDQPALHYRPAGDTGLVKALRELHRRGYESAADEAWGRSPRCQECAQMFPCPTIRLLSEHAESPSGGEER